MRIKLKILSQPPKLPIVYRQRVVAFIKHVLEAYSPEYMMKLYSANVPKFFTFNLKIPVPFSVFREGNFEFFSWDEKKFLELYLSSPDTTFLVNLASGIFRSKEFLFDNGIFNKGKMILWKVTEVSVMKPIKINGNSMLAKTVSPMLVETRENKTLIKDFFDGKISWQEIEKALNVVADLKLKSFRRYGLKETIKIKPRKMEKVVVKHTLSGFRENTGKPVMYFTCFDGVLELKGHKDDLTMLLDMGLGSRTGQGFGMVVPLNV